MAENKVGIRLTAQDETQGAFRSVTAGLGAVQTRVDGVVGAFSSLSLGAGLSAGAMVAYLKSIVDGVDALNDLADATGASVENISALEDVAARTGTSFDTVAAGLVKFNGILKDAKPGSAAEAALKALNLNVKELQALDPAEALLKTSIALQGFADDGNKARLTQELFGKSTRDVAAFLKDLAAQGSLVGTVTKQQAEEAEKFNKSLADLGKTAQDVGRYFAADLVQGINAAAKAFRDTGLIESIRTLFTGDDQHKNNVALVHQTEQILNLERAIASFKKEGYADDSRVVKAARDQLATVREELKTTLAYRKVLSGEQDKPTEPPKPSAPTIDPEADKAAAAAAKKRKEARERELAEQAKLMAELSGLSGSFAEDWARLNAVYGEGKLSLEGLTQAQAALLAKQPAVSAANAAHAKAVAEVTRAYEAEEKARADYIKGLQKGLTDTQADIRAVQDHTDRLGLGKEAIAALDAANLELQATKLDGLAIDALVIQQDTIAYQLLLDQAQALRDLATAKKQAATKEVFVDNAKAAADEWQKTTDQINQSLTDALMRGFEDGKGFADSLRDSVVNSFKTMVLRPMVSAIVNPVAQGVAGALGFSGAAQAGQAGMGSFAGSALGSLTIAGSSIAAIGSSVGTGIMATLSGSSVGAASAAYSAAGMGGVSAGLSVGAAMPYVAAALIAYQMLNGGETRSGATYDTVDGKAHLQQGPSGGEIEGTQARALFDSTQRGIRDMLAALGSKSVLTGFTAGLESSDNGKGFEFAGGFIDGRGFGESGGRTGGQFEMHSQDAKTALQDYGRELTQAMLEAMQAADLPGYLKQAFAGVDAATATQEQIAATLGFAQSLKAVREQMAETREPMQILQDAVDAGFAQLATSADTFKTDFVAAIDAGLSPNNLAAWSTLSVQMDALAASAKEAADQLARTQQQLGGALGQIGDSVAAMRKRAADAFASVIDARADIADAYLSAQDEVASAQQNLNDLLRQSADNMLAFGRSIGDFLATISPTTGAGASLTSLKAMLSSTAVLARGGDVDAQGRLIAQAQMVLKAAEAGSSTRLEYARSESFVRSLLTDVQRAVVPADAAGALASPTLAQQITQAQTALTATQDMAARYAALAELTGTSIVKSTDTVGDEIAKLRAAYDAATTEQAAANLRLDVALAALDALSLSEDALKLLTSGQTGAAPGDFATALGVSDDAITALQGAMGWTDDELAALSDAMNVHVADDIYANLGQSLGAPSDLFESLGASLGAPAELIASLASSLGLSPVQMLALQTSLGMDADTALALQTILGVDPSAQAQWATALGVDTSTLAGLGTALGWDAGKITALGTAIGLADTTVDTIRALGELDIQLGFSSAAADTIDALPGQVGFSDDAVDAIAGLSTKVGFSDAAQATIAALSSQIGMSATTRNIIDDLSTQLGFGAPALGVISNLGTSVGLMGGVISLLGSSIGLSDDAKAAIAGLSAGIGAQSSDPIVQSYQLLFGRTPESSGYDYWSGTGLTGNALFQAIRENALGEDVNAKRLRGFAVGTSFVPHDMVARIHEGEEITPRPYVDMQRESRDETNALLTRLNDRLDGLQKELAEIKGHARDAAKNTGTSADLMEGAVFGDRPLQTTAV